MIFVEKISRTEIEEIIEHLINDDYFETIFDDTTKEQMATQICSNCKKKSFTWSINGEKSFLTLWGCVKCNYRAFEDESLERNCSKCEKKSESRLKDETKEYWWCSNFNSVLEIN